jgi:hypothetical protein
MSKKKVLTGEERKAQLLEAGAKLAAKHGAVNVTRRMVAEACGCAEGLVSVYMGDSASAQKAYARRAKALGLTLPDKAKAEAIGAKLRAHGPRDKRDLRKRSIKEVEAIKRKNAGNVVANARAVGSAKLRTERETKPKAPPAAPVKKPVSKPVPSPGKAPSPPEVKTAARAPKAPPPLPPPQDS